MSNGTGDQLNRAVGINGNSYLPVRSDNRTSSSIIYGSRVSSAPAVTKAQYGIG